MFTSTIILFSNKLLKIFGTLLERPRIHQLFSPNYNVLLVMFNQDLDHCQFLLDQYRERVRKGVNISSKRCNSHRTN